MKVGIIGGTGGMGKGFALRWSQNHDVIIGSRDAARASESAVEITNMAKEAFGEIKGTITGNDNVSVAKESDVLILSIPYENIDSVCSGILSEIKDSCVVVSPIVPMTKTDVGFECVSIKDNKVLLIGAHISSYSHTGFSGHSPTRNRELLLHKNEMIRLKNVVAQKGLTIVPLKAYFKNGIAKIEFATAKGKKTYQKKDALKMKDLDREARREMSKK